MPSNPIIPDQTSLIPIAVAHGDGIGPEIMQAVLRILNKARAPLDIRTVEIGEKCYLRGCNTGIDTDAWDTIRGSAAFLKAPITTPQGGGHKSLNVSLRTGLGLYANIRPCIAYSPYVATKHPNMDVVIVRENEEDLYAGIEYHQTPEVCHSIKLISKPGSEKIIRYAFEYARLHNRKKVTCFIKDNIMKISDGLFQKTFQRIKADYPNIESNQMIVDIGAARLADTPDIFDVIVMPNLYGDILSDVAAQIAGSVGLAGSANIGIRCAMFEAIHGSAPDIAGKNIANPSGLLQAAVLMLNHLEQFACAEKIQNAWLVTLEEGIHTADIYKEGLSKQKVGTEEFANAVCARLGQKPKTFTAATSAEHEKIIEVHPPHPHTTVRELIGVDCYIFAKSNPETVTNQLKNVKLPNGIKLSLITNRGGLIWPNGIPETFCVDQWRARFVMSAKGQAMSQEQILSILHLLFANSIELIRTENLYTFDGVAGYSSAEWS